MGLFNLIRGTEKPEHHQVDSKLPSQARNVITTRRNIHEEGSFLQFLYLERRRSERTGHPLCMILLDGSSITDLVTRASAFRQVFDQLCKSIRETDTIGWYHQCNTLAVVFSDIKSADTIIVSTLHTKVSGAVSTALTPELVKCIRSSVHLFSRDSDPGAGATDPTLYIDFPSHYRSRKTEHLLKRSIDVIGSTLLLCMLAPLLVLIAIAIKVSSEGPVIFKQVRVGQQGKLFSFLKFRSMYVGNDATIHKEYVKNLISRGQGSEQTDAIYKIIHDPRITRVGQFLRRTSLDELPQLWNVFCGDMSLVGPRPPLLYEFECYALWHRRRILEVKPGITGLWQVMGRSRTSFNDMVRLDLRYVRQWSIWLDIKIILQTPKAVLMGEGAY